MTESAPKASVGEAGAGVTGRPMVRGGRMVAFGGKVDIGVNLGRIRSLSRHKLCEIPGLRRSYCVAANALICNTIH